MVKPVLATIEKKLVTRKLGRLDPEDQQILAGVLRTILGEPAGPEKPVESEPAVPEGGPGGGTQASPETKGS